MAEVVPEMIGRYQVLSVLGRGGMGVVYRALDPGIGRQVAIKTITEDFTRDPAMLRRFQSEAEKTGMLMHPNIVIVYQLGSHEGYPYIVMEFVEGNALDGLIKNNHPLPLLYKLKIIEQVCAALSYAHERSIVHRDVKPANVIVQPDGNAKLLDFGIARQEKQDRDHTLTQTGSVIGTVPYMAPERLKGAPLDGRSDIFATGVMLYQLVTGVLPFDGEEMALVHKLLYETHPPLSNYMQDYPASLDAVLERALAKDPYQRYATAEEMGADLSVIVQALTTTQVASMLQDAQRAVEGGDYANARKVLQQVIRLEAKNRQARTMLAEVQELLARRQRAEQAETRLGQARQSLENRDYSNAIGLLEQAEQLIPGDAAVTSLMEQARHGKRLQEQVDGYLRQADAERHSGNLESARVIVEKALELDKNNSRLRAAYTDLIRQAEESVRQAKMKGFLDTARTRLNLRQFQDAATILNDAEQIDPLHVDLISLRAEVEKGLREEQRRRVVEEMERQVHSVTNGDDAERVAVVLARALETMPYDSGLLRLQLELQRQQREHAERALLESTVRQCRAQLDAGDPQSALATAREALTRLPGNDQLLRLESSIEAQIAHETREQRRVKYLSDAREAMARRDFAAAIPLLTACNQEGHSEDTARMLEFAREELRTQRRTDLFTRHSAQAQSLLRESNYSAVIALLEPALLEEDEPRLRALLDKARELHAETQRKADEALETLKRITAIEDYERGLAFVESLPETLRANPRLAAARAQLESDAENEWAQLQFLGYCSGVKASTGKLPPAKERRQRMQLSGRSKLLSQMFQQIEKW